MPSSPKGLPFEASGTEEGAIIGRPRVVTAPTSLNSPRTCQKHHRLSLRHERMNLRSGGIVPKGANTGKYILIEPQDKYTGSCFLYKFRSTKVVSQPLFTSEEVLHSELFVYGPHNDHVMGVVEFKGISRRSRVVNRICSVALSNLDMVRGNPSVEVYAFAWTMWVDLIDPLEDVDSSTNLKKLIPNAWTNKIASPGPKFDFEWLVDFLENLEASNCFGLFLVVSGCFLLFLVVSDYFELCPKWC